MAIPSCSALLEVEGEGGNRVSVENRERLFDRGLNILGIKIPPADDDEILKPSSYA